MGRGAGCAAPENAMELEETVLEYIGSVENDPINTRFEPGRLCRKTSMWRAASELRSKFPERYTQELIPETSKFHPSNLYPHQKVAIAREMGFILYPNARDWAVDHELDEGEPKFKDCKKLKSVEESQFPLLKRASPSSQCLVAPPGAGKTCIALYVALLAGRNALMMTNSRANETQMLNAINDNTNVKLFFPFRMIRSNANEDGSLSEVPEELVACRTIGGALHVLPFGGVYGIAIIDVNTFQVLDNRSIDRCALQRVLFRSWFDTFVVDEADSVFAEGAREVFTHGIVDSASSMEEQQGVRGQFRYKLKYGALLAMSGTWFRADESGRKFLQQLGPTTCRVNSRDLENMVPPLLAKMTVCLVRCREADAAVEKLVEEHNMHTLSPEKMRILELIVRLHVAHGQKIMIFSHYHWHLRMIERMFPFALAISGETPQEEQKRITVEYRKKVHATHPLVWATISAGQIGMDVPDTSVVINLVNDGESATKLRQRMGRASRKEFRFGWFYDLVSDAEAPAWAPRLAGETAMGLDELEASADRYKLLFKDGYATEMLRLTSHELEERMHAHVEQLSDDDDWEAVVKDTAKGLLEDAVFAKHRERATLDHVITCVWGNLFACAQERRDATLSDVQSQLALRWKREADAAAAREQAEQRAAKRRRDELEARLNGKKKMQSRRNTMEVKRPRSSARRPAATASAPSAPPSGPRLRTEDEYLKEELDPKFAANVTVIRDAWRVLGGEAVADDAEALWAAVMRLRAQTNAVQFQSDSKRVAASKDVVQFDEAMAENCSFLHAQ